MAFVDATAYAIGGILVWLLFLPILIPMFVVFSIWKGSVLILAKFLKPDLIPISFNDAFFAMYACAHLPLMSVGVSFRVKGRLETVQFIKRFKDLFLKKSEGRYRNLFCYFEIYGGYVFKRRVDKLNLLHHFVEETLPKEVEPEEFLEKWLVSDSFHRGQPCWQVIVLRQERRDETVVSIKMHHGMTDGYSLVHMIDKLTGSTSPYLVEKRKKESIWKQIIHILQGPALALDVLFRAVTTMDLVKQGDPFHKDWVMSFSTMHLDFVKNVRKQANSKFSSVMITAAVGALKRYYLEDKKAKEDKFPSQIWTEAPLALPNHPAMTKGGAICNHFSAGIYATPLGNDNRSDRLRSLEKDFYSFQNHGGILLMSWVLFGFYWLQPAVILRIYTNYCSYLFRFSILYSALMTSPTKVSLVGQPVENIYFLQATASAFPYVSLFLMCSTYAGKLDVTCYASRSLFEDKRKLEKFVQVHLKTELESMMMEFSGARCKNTVVNLEGILNPEEVQ